VFILASCVANAVPLTPGGQAVLARKSDPPRGAQEIGPIEVTHGSGCGGFGEKGTYEGALALLRNRGARMGADYVQIMTMTQPHSEVGCFDNSFVIRGIAYKLGSPPPAATVAPAAATTSCDPPCSPGYSCERDRCVPVCNPACDANEICNAKRVCVPAAATTP